MKGSQVLKLIVQGGGAAGGAKIGSMICPGWGTAIGAGVGWVVGLAAGSEEDNTSSQQDLAQRLQAAERKGNKKIEKLIKSLNNNKTNQQNYLLQVQQAQNEEQRRRYEAQAQQAQQQYQQSQQQFLLMMMLFMQNQKPALEAGQSIAREELKEIKQSLKDAEKQNQELLAKIKELEQEKTEKSEEKENIEQQINQLDQDLAEKKIDAEEHQQRVVILREQEKAAQNRIDEIIASVATLQKELSNCAGNKEELLAKKQQVETTLTDYQTQMNKLAETLNNVAGNHGINKQVPIINVNAEKPLQSTVPLPLPNDDISSLSSASDYQDQKNTHNTIKDWFNDAKPYLKWGGIGLIVLLLLTLVFKFFKSLLSFFHKGW